MPSFPRTVSLRPTLTVDARAGRVAEPTGVNRTYPGTPSAFGEFRIVTCLPTNGAGPVMVMQPLVLGDGQSYLGDPFGNFVGEHGPQYIHRLLSARWTENTRRLGG
jgi:hypothetical protein